MKKYDPYKRLILFIASFINILLLCLLFAAGWYRYYAGTMYVITFYRRGALRGDRPLWYDAVILF